MSRQTDQTRLSQRNAVTERVQTEQLRRLGLGTEAPLEHHPDTSAFMANTSNPAAIAGAFQDAADDAGRSAVDGPVRGKSPFTLGK
jgi:hypothetical protein